MEEITMGGGITGGKGNPQVNRNLEDNSKYYLDLMKPLLEQSQGQVGDILSRGTNQFNDLTSANAEALQTGASQAYLPSIQRARQSALRGVAQAQARTHEDLTRQGITGSDYNTIMSNALEQGYF